jgi:hypothetical protein
MVVWPRALKRAPGCWKHYCEHWEELQGIPKGLNGVAAAAVLHVITAAMSEDAGMFNCFLTVATIACRAHVSERTVQRVLAWQRDAASPLLAIERPGQTRGMWHACHRFTLVLEPMRFAACRDAARAKKVSRVQERQAAQHYDDLEDQVRMLRAEITDDQYSARKAARVAEARGDLPKRVNVGRSRK